MYIEVVEEASKHANILSFNPGALLASLWNGKPWKMYWPEPTSYF